MPSAVPARTRMASLAPPSGAVVRERMVATTDEKRHAAKIVRCLKRDYPDAQCALIHENAFQLLIATILSAQCTDDRVNQVTAVLFDKYPTPAQLANAPLKSIEKIIQSTGFFRNKAKNIKACCQDLVAAPRRPSATATRDASRIGRRGSQDGQCRPGDRIWNSIGSRR